MKLVLCFTSLLYGAYERSIQPFVYYYLDELMLEK